MLSCAKRGEMSKFRTTEHFYAEQDAFRRYIADKVNPARKAAGLSEIRDEEARECFRIIDHLAGHFDTSYQSERHGEQK